MSESMLEKKYVETENGNIFYFAHCIFPGQPTVLLLHGLSSNHTTWDNITAKLSEMKINTIAPDLRGHGFSDKTRNRKLCTISRNSRDIELILEKEKIDRVMVVGYSWGGNIAIDYTITYPKRVSSLVLISASHLKPLSFSPFFFVATLYRWFLICLGYLLIWQKRKNYHYFVHNKTLGYWASTMTGFSTMPLSINFWMLSEVLKVDYKNTISSISCPTLIIYGKSDGYINEKEIQEMHQKIKNSEVVYMDNKGHYLGSWYQDEVAKYVMEFIKTNLK